MCGGAGWVRDYLIPTLIFFSILAVLVPVAGVVIQLTRMKLTLADHTVAVAQNLLGTETLGSLAPQPGLEELLSLYPFLRSARP